MGLLIPHLLGLRKKRVPVHSLQYMMLGFFFFIFNTLLAAILNKMIFGGTTRCQIGSGTRSRDRV